MSFLSVIDANAGRWRADRADIEEGFIRISTFDTFVFNAVGETYGCRNTLARYDLMIARQMLDHARLASEGHPDRDWTPSITVANSV